MRNSRIRYAAAFLVMTVALFLSSLGGIDPLAAGATELGKADETVFVSAVSADKKGKKERFSFTKRSLSLVPNRTVKLRLTRKVVGVVFRSSKPKVVTVSADGTIRSKKKGIAKITATAGGMSAQLKVHVLKKSGSWEDRVRRRVQSANSAASMGRGKRVLIAGSSTIDRWTSVDKAFPGCQVINTGMGGSTAIQWQDYYRDLIIPYDPDAVVLYVGTNDIGDTGLITGEECARQVQSLIKGIRTELGRRIPIFYVSIVHSQRRKGAWKEQRKANQLMEAYCASNRNLFYIDIASKLLDKRGNPIKAYFRSDGIHPNAKGYQIFNRVIGKKVLKKLKKH